MMPTCRRFTTRLQRAPSDFYLPDFYLKREDLLKKRLAELDTKDDWRSHMGRMFNAKYGITNVLVDWSDELLSACYSR